MTSESVQLEIVTGLLNVAAQSIVALHTSVAESCFASSGDRKPCPSGALEGKGTVRADRYGYGQQPAAGLHRAAAGRASAVHAIYAAASQLMRSQDWIDVGLMLHLPCLPHRGKQVQSMSRNDERHGSVVYFL